MIRNYATFVVCSSVLQLFMFYIFPLFAGPTDAMGLVVLIILSVFVLSILLGFISKNGFKYFYPFVIDILFISSVFIYYHETALVHSLWYFTISSFGILFSIIVIYNMLTKKGKR